MNRTFLEEVRVVILWSIAGLVVFLVGIWIYFMVFLQDSDSRGMGDGFCNIAVAPIEGNILSYSSYNSAEDKDKAKMMSSDRMSDFFDLAESNPSILGVLVKIDSSGGTPVASEIIANRLKKLSLPTVALIHEQATSGAYLAATGADIIIASAFSDIGSIGITMSYLDNTLKNTKEGLQYIELTSAKFKGYGSPDRPLSMEERKLIDRDLKIYHKQFIKEVSENRKMTIEQVEKLADGSSMPGELALQNKLIDKIGDLETARTWFAEQLKISPKEVIFCK